MIKEIDFQNQMLVQKLYELQREAYMIEANLINFFDIPPLTESLEDFLEVKETFHGYFEGDELAGAVSFEMEGDTVTICRMVVHPNHFRKGIAQKLLTSLEESMKHIHHFKVSTGRENDPAKRLYLKNGFYHVSDIEIVPGLYISHFEKISKKTGSS